LINNFIINDPKTVAGLMQGDNNSINQIVDSAKNSEQQKNMTEQYSRYGSQTFGQN
jgi:hypothetical protein